MTFRLLGRSGALASLALRGSAATRFSRRDDIAALDPALAPLDAAATDPALAVSDVVAVQPVEKAYRATVTRTVTQTAVVEFLAMEGTDTMTLAQGLLESIPAESWVTQPADSWGYIDKIEEAGAPVETLDDEFLDETDPLATPAVLSRHRRAMRFAGKAAFDVSVDGVYFATYEAETPEDAILAYANESGAATVDEAAENLGMTLEDFLLAVTATEALVELDDELPAEEDEEELPPETLARRRRAARSRRSRRSRFARKMIGTEALAEIDRLGAEADAAVAASDGGTLRALLDVVTAITVDDPADIDAAAVESAKAELIGYINNELGLIDAAAGALGEVLDEGVAAY